MSLMIFPSCFKKLNFQTGSKKASWKNLKLILDIYDFGHKILKKYSSKTIGLFGKNHQYFLAKSLKKYS